MSDQLKALIEARDVAKANVIRLKEERKAITEAVKTESRSDLTDEEAVLFRALTGKIADAQAEVREIDADIEAEQAEIDRRGAEEKRKATTEVNEPLTYVRGNGKSYFRDMAKMQLGLADEATKDRIFRHEKDVATNRDIKKIARVGEEYRNLDRNDGSGGYLVPPLWVMNELIELARSGRAYANLVSQLPLPSGTDSINVPKILTGTATAIQTADNASIQETDLTDTSVQAPVKTIAGMQGIAIQAIEQSPLDFDQVIFRDLAADYATKLDLQVIQGSNSSGQVKGVRNASGIITITATDSGTETSKGQTVWKKIADGIQRVHTQRFMAPQVIVMHPRRWSAFTAMLDSNGRPLVVPNGPAQNQLGEFGGVVSQQVVGTMHGLPVVTDPNMPTTLGAGTNEDVIHVLKADDLWLFESSVRTRALSETRATGLTVLLQIYGYLAFTAERQPKSVVEIGGTALTAPTFA